MNLLLFLAGLAALVAGAELLVKGAAQLSRRFGLSPLLVGLTVVSLGTSAPEVAVGVAGAIGGSGELALGNVVGSNICNVLLILGVSALITPLVVAQALVRLDVPLMIGSAALLFALALDGAVGRLDGLLLLALLVAWLGLTVRAARRTEPAVREQYAQRFGAKGALRPPGLAPQLGLVLAGLVLLVIGSQALVTSAQSFARALGVSELVIALTVVAAGTSLPELATSVLAAWRGERDIAVGNVVGSNIINVLLVMGASGLVAPRGVVVPGAALHFDLPVMIAASVACLPIFVSGFRISRAEGATLLGCYLAYTAYLVLRAAEHEILPALNGVMLAFVAALGLTTLAVIGWRALRRQRPS